MKKINHICRITSNKKISSGYYRLCLESKTIVESASAGQFVHIQVNDGVNPFFRRPFSIHRTNDNALSILYEVVGPGTQILALKQKGDRLSVLGPLGNSFSNPPTGTEQVVMIAGGVGIAPFLILSDFLKGKNYDLTLLYGVRSSQQIFDLEEYQNNGLKIFIATDDGSQGVKGRVSALFKNIDAKNKKTFIYACGPRSMLVAVQNYTKTVHLQGEVSAEEVMACGIGVCLGCAAKTKAGYKTVCNDGPVFDIHEFEG